MSKKIFIINGTGGCGKDTIVNIVAEHHHTINIDSVRVVKRCANLLGWDYTKTEENRLFLSELKKLSDRYFNHSTKYVISRINEFISSDAKVAFVHIREPHLIDKVKYWCIANEIDCKTILVKNDNVQQIETNQSDKNVLNYEYDMTIDNSGTLEELEVKVINNIIKTQI